MSAETCLQTSANRRSPEANEAALCRQRCRAAARTRKARVQLTTHKGYGGSRNESKHQKLAEHTVAGCYLGERDVPMTLVTHTFGTLPGIV